MNVVPKNLNASRHRTMPLSGVVCNLWVRICYIINLATTVEVSNSIRYEDMKNTTKYGKWDDMG